MTPPGSATAPESQPWDPGGQPERTRLAWQRTALSGLACSLVVSKLVGGHSVVLGFVLAALAILTTVAMLVLGRIRYQRANAALFARDRLPDGRINAATVVLITITGVGAVFYAVLESIIERPQA